MVPVILFYTRRITGAENKEEEEEKDQKVKEQEKREGHDACLFRSRPLPKRPEENNSKMVILIVAFESLLCLYFFIVLDCMNCIHLLDYYILLVMY